MFANEDADGITPEELIAKYQRLQGQLHPTTLEGIDSIDWSTLHHALGEANDFPILLLATFSDDEQDRDFAIRLLFETIWHQGTVYEASAYAIPFLLKALEAPEMLEKPRIAMLVACLADGNSYLDVHALSSKKGENMWRKILAKKHKDLETEIKQELEYVKATREAVGKGLHLLYPYLQDGNVSYDIAKALAFYPERKAETIPLLEKAYTSIVNEDAKEEIKSTLTKLREANTS